MTKPRLFLCETDKTKICELETSSMSGSFKFNAYSELNFTVGRTYTNMITGETQVNPYYNKIEALRLVYLEGFGYFEIQSPEVISDGIQEVKNVSAYSLEYSLSQKYLENFDVNTGKNTSIEVIYGKDKNKDGKITFDEVRSVVLYDDTIYLETNDPKEIQYREKHSLMHLILEKAYGWSIRHIDATLRSMTRQFEISRASVYDFIMQDVCDKFNCFAEFDTINNTISLYAEAPVMSFDGDGVKTSFIISPAFQELETVTINGYKTTEYTYNKNTGELIFLTAPIIGANIEVTDGSQMKYMTDIYVSFDNLVQEVSVNYSADDIKTQLTVKGADDLDIRDVNMGAPYIIDLSYYHDVDWMGEELYDAYAAYLQTSNNGSSEYKNNAIRIQELDHLISYEYNRMSLNYEVAEDITYETSGKYYVRWGTFPHYYYTEVSLPSEYNAYTTYYNMLPGGINITKVENLYVALRRYFNSQDEKDTSKISELQDDFAFMKVNTITSLVEKLENVNTLDKKNAAVSEFLDEALDHLGLTPLVERYKKYYESIKTADEEAGDNDPESANYWLYYPVELMLDAINKEIDDRKNIIKPYEEERDALKARNGQIKNNSSIDAFFKTYYVEQGFDEITSIAKAKQLLSRLSPFLREDEYTDDNFSKTSADTIETLMQTQKELLECGRIELSKLCSPKLQFSMDMANIYALPEFEPIVDKFQLGNIINIKLRESQTEMFTIVGDGATTEFIVLTSFDAIKDITFNDSGKLGCTYDSKTGALTFAEAPQVDAKIDVTLVKYYIKQSRLLQVDINFDDFSDFSCEFGELTSLRSPSSIHADLLANALSAGKSVASSATYWQKGADLATSTDKKIQQGLISAIGGIYNSDQSITIDDSGILLRKVNDDGSFSPYQAWLTSNTILLSSDGFRQGSTPRMGLGEFTVDGATFYGILAEAVLSGYIEGSKIVGGTINIGDGAFVVHEDGTVTMNAEGNIIDGYAKEDYVNTKVEDIHSLINKMSDIIVSPTEPENADFGQIWLDTSTAPYILKVFTQIGESEDGQWEDFDEEYSGVVHATKPSKYSENDLWILASGEVCGNFGPGSILRATTSSDDFNSSHWVDAMSEQTELLNNIKQYFTFNKDSGLKIGQTDDKFYVNISSTEMGFYDNSEGTNAKVVSIGNESATIKNMVVEENAQFDCNAKFNNEVRFGSFIWKVESNGSLSLAVDK
jgi:hypothetical protein